MYIHMHIHGIGEDFKWDRGLVTSAAFEKAWRGSWLRLEIIE